MTNDEKKQWILAAIGFLILLYFGYCDGIIGLKGMVDILAGIFLTLFVASVTKFRK